MTLNRRTCWQWRMAFYKWIHSPNSGFSQICNDFLFIVFSNICLKTDNVSIVRPSLRMRELNSDDAYIIDSKCLVYMPFICRVLAIRWYLQCSMVKFYLLMCVLCSFSVIFSGLLIGPLMGMSHVCFRSCSNSWHAPNLTPNINICGIRLYAFVPFLKQNLDSSFIRISICGPCR